MFETVLSSPGVLPVSPATALPDQGDGFDPSSVWPDDHTPPPPPK
jgi:hypothetical protein